MNHDHHSNDSHDSQPPSFWRSRYAIGLAVLGVIAAYFLLTEHRAHVAGALPLLILLACPLMHVFMHHGHGDHGHAQGGDATNVEPKEPAKPNSGGPQ